MTEKLYPTILDPEKLIRSAETEKLIDSKLKDIQKFNNYTLMIKEIKNYFEQEVLHYKKKYKSTKIKLGMLLISEGVVTVSGAAVGTTLTLTGVGATIGVPVGAGVVAASGLTTKIIGEYLNKKQQQYLKMYTLAQTKAEDFNTKYQKAMEDRTIDEHEYKELVNKYQAYKENKSTLKKKLFGETADSTHVHKYSNTSYKYFLD